MADKYKVVGGAGGEREEIAEWIQPKSMKKGEKLEGSYVDSFSKGEGEDRWTAHKIRKEDGKLVAIYGTGKLNHCMSQVVKGANCRITYEGKEKVTEGKLKGKSIHQFKVEATETVGAGEEAPF